MNQTNFSISGVFTKLFTNLWFLGIGAIFLPFVLAQAGDSWVRITAMAMLYVMLALGLNIVVGMAGLLDLGYIAFFALGAYLYGILASPHLMENFEWIAAAYPLGIHVNVFVILPFAALLAGTFGVILGAPTLKLRGDYLAIVTLGFGEIIRIFMNNMNQPVNITNGPKGITLIDPATIGEWTFDKGLDLGFMQLSMLQLYYFLFLFIVVIIVILNYRLQQSRIGRAWVAIREDEVAAKAMGINTRNLKLLAFAMGASFGGVSGALFAALQGFISPESFTLNESIVVLAMVVLGGIGHIPGVIVGALMLAVFPELLRHGVVPLQETLFGKVIIDAEVIRSLLYGLAMVLVMLYKPKGLWPAPAHGENLNPQSSKVVA